MNALNKDILVNEYGLRMESRMEFTPNDMLMVGVYVCLITITRRTRRVNGCVLFPTHVILHEKMIYGEIMRDARL